MATDGAVKVEGHTWSTGFNAGIMFSADAGYENRRHLSFGDHAQYQRHRHVLGPSPAAQYAQWFARSAARRSICQDIETVGLSQKITPDFTLLGEIDRFGWSKFNNITIKLSDGTPSLFTAENYRNTWSAALGGEYQLTAPLKLRAGVKYDETPTTDGFRDTRVPDGDRFWVSAGLNYRISERMNIDAGYSHIFVKSTPVNVTRTFYDTAPLPIPTSSQIVAQSKVRLDILSLGLNYRFLVRAARSLSTCARCCPSSRRRAAGASKWAIRAARHADRDRARRCG